ncbi:MAG: hypothetical protein ACE5HX_07960 [bacterium]
MKRILIPIILFYFLLFWGCEHERNITPPELRPEGWIALGLDNVQVNRLELVGDWLYACANKDGLYRIHHPANEGDQWQFLGLADERIAPGDFGITDVVSLKDTIVAGNSGNFAPDIPGIYRSINDGRTWVVSDSGFIKNEIYTSSAFVRRLVQSPLDPRMLLAGGRSAFLLYLSLDFGRSWNMIFDLLQGEVSFHVVGFHPRQENEIWVGGRIPNSGRPLLYRSTDLGTSWRELLQRPHDPNGPWDEVNDIAFDQEDDETVYISMNQVIIKTTNSGESWFTSLDTLKAGVFWNVTASPFGESLIACSTHSLYYTADRGNAWRTFAAAPENIPYMKDLVVDWDRRILYVSTYNPSRGLYKLYF